jgi:hypothetical protein
VRPAQEARRRQASPAHAHVQAPPATPSSGLPPWGTQHASRSNPHAAAPEPPHGPLHSLAAAGMAGLASGVLADLASQALHSRGFGWLVDLLGASGPAWGVLVFLGYLAHLLEDGCAPSGVLLWWPLSRQRVGLYQLLRLRR